MTTNRKELEQIIEALNANVTALMAEIMETGDELADHQLKLALLEDSNNHDFQDLRVSYVRRLVRSRRKLDDLNNTLSRKQDRLAKAKDQLRDAPDHAVAAQ